MKIKLLLGALLVCATSFAQVQERALKIVPENAPTKDDADIIQHTLGHMAVVSKERPQNPPLGTVWFDPTRRAYLLFTGENPKDPNAQRWYVIAYPEVVSVPFIPFKGKVVTTPVPLVQGIWHPYTDGSVLNDVFTMTNSSPYFTDVGHAMVYDSHTSNMYDVTPMKVYAIFKAREDSKDKRTLVVGMFGDTSYDCFVTAKQGEVIEPFNFYVCPRGWERVD